MHKTAVSLVALFTMGSGAMGDSPPAEKAELAELRSLVQDLRGNTGVGWRADVPGQDDQMVLRSQLQLAF